MAAMRKEDVIRLFIDSLPGNFLFYLMKLPDLLFFFTFCNRIFVALEADRYRWHSRKILGLEVAMAGVALHSLCEMFLMIKEDRLIRLRSQAQTDQKEEQNNPDSQSNKEGFHFQIPSI